VREILQSRGLAISMVAGAAVMFALGLLNLIINTDSPASWAPLMILMPFIFFQGLRQLRANKLPSADL
jgi:biotin transporter BioY